MSHVDQSIPGGTKKNDRWTKSNRWTKASQMDPSITKFRVGLKSVHVLSQLSELEAVKEEIDRVSIKIVFLIGLPHVMVCLPVHGWFWSLCSPEF